MVLWSVVAQRSAIRPQEPPVTRNLHPRNRSGLSLSCAAEGQVVPGRWILLTRTGNGSGSSPAAKDADRFMVTARAQVQRGTYTPDTTSATIGEACDLWVERAKAEGLEHGAQQQYRQHRAHILRVIERNAKLSWITTARCEQVRDDLLNAHSRDMARKVWQSFEAVIRDAGRRGLIASNPAAETTIGTNGRHTRKRKAGVHFPMPG